MKDSEKRTARRQLQQPPPEFVDNVERLLKAAVAEGLTRQEAYACLHAWCVEVDRTRNPVVDASVLLEAVDEDKAARFKAALKRMKHARAN